MRKLAATLGLCTLVACSSYAQEPVIIPTTAEVMSEGWIGNAKFGPLDGQVFFFVRPSVTVTLENDSMAYPCVLLIMAQNSRGQQVELQESFLCFFYPTSMRWEASFTWVRWGPKGLSTQVVTATGSFDALTGAFWSDLPEAEVVYLEQVEPEKW